MMSMKQALFLLLARSSCNFNINSISVASAFVSAPTQWPSERRKDQLWVRPYSKTSFASPTSPVLLLAKPKQAGSTVDNYQTVSVNCSKCQQRLFRYKKKNGTKSNLVKCYIERVSEDSAGVLALAASKQNPHTSKPKPNSLSSNNGKNNKKKNQNGKQNGNPNNDSMYGKNEEDNTCLVPDKLDPSYSWECPSCNTQFARSSMIHGRPALKMVGGKIRMTKK